MTTLFTLTFPALLVITLLGFIIPKSTRPIYGYAVAITMFFLIFTLGWEKHQNHSIIKDLIALGNKESTKE